MMVMLSLINRLGLFSGAKPRVISCFNGCMYRYWYCSIGSKLKNDSEEKKTEKWVPFSNASSSLINHNVGKYHEKSQLDSNDIMVVDSDTWRVSCGLASVCKGMDNGLELKGFDVGGDGDGLVGNDDRGTVEECPDFDEIEDMRVYGNLFYKIDRSSMEFEECRIDFRRKRNSSNGIGNDKRDEKVKEKPSCESSNKGQVDSQTMKKKRSANNEILVNEERLKRTIKENYTICLNDNKDSSIGKKRTPTFNQLTGPYHEPFCLDIYVSKGSVRASVIHRATSKVVAVAHSISKDIKYDLGSAKSRTAAATVGKILAQRALEDDIHNVMFTPRKGDKLEGKLQIVLQSIMDNGVDVKVKLKQRNPGRPFAKLNCFKY